MQTAAFRASDLSWTYAALRVQCDDLPDVWSSIETDPSVIGLNVTIPLKEVVLRHLDRVDTRDGSVNTIVFDAAGDAGVPRRAIGHSTDGAGFVAALRRVDVGPRRRAVILGTGGAARASAAALRAEGSEVAVLGRNVERGKRLAGDLGVEFEPWERVEAGAVAAFERHLDGADLLANATPIGTGDLDASPLPAGVRLPAGLTVFDLVYRPRRTALLRQAAEQGCRTVEGIEMLVEQGARSFSLWTGRPAPVDVMRAAAYAALGGAESGSGA
jgi:shikimate dehydrogenase